MSAQLPDLSSRARWIIHTQLAALRRSRRRTPGVHTPATGFIPFTGPARDSIACAWLLVRQAGHHHWDPGHLLLGLIAQDHGVAAQALQRLGISPDQIRRQARPAPAADRPRDVAGAGPPPRPHPAEGVIPAVLAQAAAHCDYQIGTQHLLLALFRADDQAAAQVLARLGAGEGQVRDAITAVLAEAGPERGLA